MLLPSLFWGPDERAPSADWEILGDHRPGTYAELVSVPLDCVRPKPAGLSWAQAAALPLVGLTTYRALFSRGRLAAGESLLVLGAGGGVATMALACAIAADAQVAVTSGSERKIEQAVGAGAVGGVSYRRADWPTAVRRFSAEGRGFDLVLDSVGDWQRALETLRPGGRVVTLGASVAEQAAVDVRRFYFGQYDLLGTTMGSPRDFDGFLAFAEKHAVRPVIAAEFALAQAAEAHARVENGEGMGKYVLLAA